MEQRLDPQHFQTLLRAWNHHQDLRRDGADVLELAASRIALDDARSAVRS